MNLRHFLATWGITKACNFGCVQCLAAAGRRFQKDDLPLEHALAIVRRIGELGITRLAWSGGEPLLRMDLEAIMAYGSNYGIGRYSLVTNGYLLDRARAKSLYRSGLRSIQIGLDGVDEDQNRLLRKGPRDCYKKAINAVITCLEEGFAVSIGTMLYPEAVPKLDAMYDLASRLGVHMLRFSAFVPNGRGKDQSLWNRMALSPDMMTEFLRFLRRRYFEKPGFIGLDRAFSFNPFEGSFPRSEGVDQFFIDYKADVFPSIAMDCEVYKIGNALYEDLADILTRPSLAVPQPTRSSLRGPCRRCPDFDLCEGGARGIAYMFSGVFTESPRLCLGREYRSRSSFLGDPFWIRFTSNLHVEELRVLDSIVMRHLGRKTLLRN